MPCNTHEIVDFGPGPQDQITSYPFAGTEKQCIAWLRAYQQSALGRDRYAMHEILEED